MKKIYILGVACLFTQINDGFCTQRVENLRPENHRITKPVSYGEFIQKKLANRKQITK